MEHYTKESDAREALDICGGIIVWTNIDHTDGWRCDTYEEAAEVLSWVGASPERGMEFLTSDPRFGHDEQPWLDEVYSTEFADWLNNNVQE